MEIPEMVRKMKILFITTGAFPVPAVKGGAAEGLVELMLQENEASHLADFTVISIYDADAVRKSKDYQHTRFIFIKPGSFWKGCDSFNHFIAWNVLHASNHLAFMTTWQRIDFMKQAAQILEHEDFDKVVFENQMALLWTLKYQHNLEKYKGRYYFHLHNHPAKYAKAETLAAGCAGIIPVSRFIGAAFAEHIGIPYTEEQFHVVKNVVDESIFDPNQLSSADIESIRRKYVPEGQKLVLYVGRLLPGKGVAELMEAFARMKTDNAVLVIVGSFNFNDKERSPYDEKLHEFMQKTNRKILFTGFVPHDRLPAYYASADLVILPSTCEEAAGLTIIETMMMHRPLITTTIGGIPEYADKGCAVLIDNDVNLVQNLANAADELLNDPERCEQMCRNSASATKNWNKHQYLLNFLEALQ